MIPELGHFALWLALGVALVQGIVPLVGAHRGQRRLDGAGAAAAARAVRARRDRLRLPDLRRSCSNDFSVLYVATNSNSALPLPYRIAGVWGGHEGSLLLWVLMLCVLDARRGAASAATCRCRWWRASWR